MERSRTLRPDDYHLDTHRNNWNDLEHSSFSPATHWLAHYRSPFAVLCVVYLCVLSVQVKLTETNVAKNKMQILGTDSSGANG